MTASDHIVDVSESDFQYEVLAYSSEVPVVVDFWAEWCGPCRMLGPILEKLANEAQGAFRLAKVDVDDNQNLALQYGIRGIPAVKVFHNGQVVAEFTGAQPEAEVRKFLRNLAPSSGDLMLDKGSSLIGMGAWSEAEDSFREVLEARPDNGAALLGLAKSLIAQGEDYEALEILKNFPAGKEYKHAEMLLPLAEALTQREEVPAGEDLGPAFGRVLQLVGMGNIPAAIDGLLDILREDKSYLDGQARKVVLGLLELLDQEAEQTRQYRAELASVLF